MNSISVRSNHFLSPLGAPPRTVFPSSPSTEGRPSPSPHSPRGPVGGWFSTVEDRVSNGLALGLFAVTLPTVAYALNQLWHLVGGETLNHAVRAFAP